MPNVPETDNPVTVDEALSYAEQSQGQIVQLQEQVAQLNEQLEQMKRLNKNLSSQLSVALAVNHAPVLKIGTGMSSCVLNARAIETLYLEQGISVKSYPAQPSGTWRVMADKHGVSEYLEPEKALAKLREIEHQWITALEPPSPR